MLKLWEICHFSQRNGVSFGRLGAATQETPPKEVSELASNLHDPTLLHKVIIFCCCFDWETFLLCLSKKQKTAVSAAKERT